MSWDIITTDDESVVMVGVRGENTDFYGVKLDADGGVVWEWEVSHLLVNVRPVTPGLHEAQQ